MVAMLGALRAAFRPSSSSSAGHRWSEPRTLIGPAGLLANRLTIVAGPAVGLSRDSPRAVGRAAVGYSF
jgi:hypothetical protein